MYSAHMGNVANALTDLTAVATNGQNQTAGPFMASVPNPPTGLAGVLFVRAVYQRGRYLQRVRDG